MKCIQLPNQGHTQSFLAELLVLDEKTGYNWKHTFLGAKNLQQFIADQPRNYLGKVDRLKKLLCDWLDTI
ncbi:MAG: hypothetical protein AAGC64_12035 [Bacteroidota bacterium]